MDTIELHTYQKRLVESIQAQQLLSNRVAEAFLKIPRHPFVSHYYVHVPGSREWIRSEQDKTATWYEHIYQDHNLVTRIDEYGRSLSSSSQPGVMALMLDALNIEPAMRILEIGTGTGYNAALLTALTGDPHLVTSIDIDALAIEQAQKALKDVVGEGITVVQGDGSQGYRENAPYDRIIVTASTTTVPWAWVEQLASNGLLVCVLQPHYAMLGGILRVEKQGESLRGRVLNTASFMALRGTTYPKRKIQISFSAPVIESFHFEPAFFHPQLLREDVHFAFFLYSLLPDLYVFQRRQENMMVFYQEATPQGYLVFRSSVVELRGEPSCARKLWSRLVRLYSFWLHCGEPKITQYHFSMEASSNQALSLTTPNGIIWPFTEENQR